MGQILTNELDKTSTNVATWHKLKMKPRNDDEQRTTTRRRKKKKIKKRKKNQNPKYQQNSIPPKGNRKG